MIIGVVAFLALDAVLVGLALTSSREVESSTSYIEPTPHPPTPRTTPTPEPGAALPVTRSLAAAGDTIWRAEAGSCVAGTPTLLQTSSDAGTTWADRDLLRYDVRQVLALAVSNATYGEAAVRIGDSCELAGLRTFTSGQFWEREDEVLDGLSFLDTSTNQVFVQGTEQAPPCPDAIQVLSRPDEVRLLCADGTTESWRDSSWALVGRQLGALSMVDAVDSTSYLLANETECLLGLGQHPVGQPSIIDRCVETAPVPGSSLAVSDGGRTWVWSAAWWGEV